MCASLETHYPPPLITTFTVQSLPPLFCALSCVFTCVCMCTRVCVCVCVCVSLSKAFLRSSVPSPVCVCVTVRSLPPLFRDPPPPSLFLSFSLSLSQYLSVARQRGARSRVQKSFLLRTCWGHCFQRRVCDLAWDFRLIRHRSLVTVHLIFLCVCGGGCTH